MCDHCLCLYDEDKNYLHSLPSVPGLKSLRKHAKEHKGFAIYYHETYQMAETWNGWKRFYFYDYCDIYHNGEIVKRIDLSKFVSYEEKQQADELVKNALDAI